MESLSEDHNCPVFSNACVGPVMEHEIFVCGDVWGIVNEKPEEEAGNKADQSRGGKTFTYVLSIQRILDGAIYDGGGRKWLTRMAALRMVVVRLRQK